MKGGILYGDALQRRAETAETFREASRDRRHAWRRTRDRARDALSRPPTLIWIFNLGLLSGLASGDESGDESGSAGPLRTLLRTASVVRLLGALGGGGAASSAEAGAEAAAEEELAGSGLESMPT